MMNLLLTQPVVNIYLVSDGDQLTTQLTIELNSLSPSHYPQSYSLDQSFAGAARCMLPLMMPHVLLVTSSPLL
jgi:hypothetical protein